MTLPKKGLRKITVDEVMYAWNTTGNDDSINLSIIPLKQQNRLIRASFNYHSKVIHEWVDTNGFRGQSAKQQIVITGYIVRQVILYALNSGWNPTGGIAVLNLGAMDNNVDIRI